MEKIYKNQPPIVTGKICYNNDDEMFIVGDRTYEGDGASNIRFNVIFPYTGYESTARQEHIKNGSVSDEAHIKYTATGKERVELGKRYINSSGAPYMAIRFICKSKYHERIFEVEFERSKKRIITEEFDIISGYVKPSWKGSIKNSSVNINIGDEYINKQNKKFKVIRYFGANQSDFTNTYEIQFIESGYTCIVEDAAILNNGIKDRFSPTLKGIGYLGNKIPYTNKMYSLWQSMMTRCYGKNSKSYIAHGGRGVRVCDRWHCFENFINDIPLIEGYNESLFENGLLELDKDKKQRCIPIDKKVYSLETCTFLSQSENRVMIGKTKPLIAIDENGNMYPFKSVRRCEKELNISDEIIKKCMEGEKNNHNGYKFIPKFIYDIQTIHNEMNMSMAMYRIDGKCDKFLDKKSGMLRAMIRQPK